MISPDKSVISAHPNIDPKLRSGESTAGSFEVLGVPIVATTLDRALHQASSWLAAGTPTRMVTFTNVHMLTEAHRNPDLLNHLRRMDMNCPDGMPLVWLGQSKGWAMGRVCGPEFMLDFCSSSASNPYRHFFYGGKPGVAELVIKNLKKVNPGFQVAGFYTPPLQRVDCGRGYSNGSANQ